MIKDLQTNEFLNQANFLVKRLDKKMTANGKPFYEAILSDRSGEIVARI
jgi:23S rRNA maturation-related 3'-5' exoribonuclease YhaM